MNPSFDEFDQELKKFSGFMMPDNVRNSVSAALKEINDPEFIIPVDSSKSSIIQAFSDILKTKKTAKLSNPLVCIMCVLLSNYFIRDDAATQIVRIIEGNLNSMDQNTSLKVIQLTTSIFQDHIYGATTLQSIFSIVLNFSNSQDTVVCTSARAAVEQLLKQFNTAIFQSKNNIVTELKREIDISLSLVEEIPKTIEKHTEKLAYVFYRDLIQLCAHNKPYWLRLEFLHQDFAFYLLQNIIITNFYTNLFQETLKIAISQKAPIDFFVTIFEKYIKKAPSQAIIIVNSFLNDLVPKGVDAERPMKFFLLSFTRSVNIIPLFLSNCDRNANILTSIIRNLKPFCDSFIGDTKFDISISAKVAGKLNGTELFQSGPVDIAISFIQTSYKIKNDNIKKLIQSCWNDLLMIISISLPFITDECIYLSIQSLTFLIMLSNELNIDDARISVSCTFCTCLASSQSFIQTATFETVTSLIENAPSSFVGNWGKIFQALIPSNWIPDTGIFSTKLNDDQVIEVVLALLSINTDSKKWPLAFIVKILCSNKHRFHIIWQSLEGYLLLLLDDHQTTNEALNTFVSLLQEDFTKETEEDLLITLERLFAGRRKLEVQGRSVLLDQIKAILAQKGTIIKHGWPYLINALSPKNFQDEEDILAMSFRCVQIICGDLLFLLDIETKLLSTNLFFEFALQTTDINIALSAFELMWSVIAMAKTSEMWRLIFSKLVSLIKDQRNDVALCAARTFFSLIMSNINSLPDDVVEFIPNDCFFPILNGFPQANQATESTEQLVLYELAHVARAMWDKFSHIENFPVDFIRALIKQQETFFQQIKKRDVACQALQFYEEILMTKELSKETRDYLMDSLEVIAKYSIDKYDANNGVWTSWGRVIQNTLPGSKELVDFEMISRWLRIMHLFLIELDCGKFLPPTAHKVFESIQLLFPLDTELLTEIYKFCIICAAQTKNQPLSEIALQNMLSICENQVKKEDLPQLFILSKDIFHLV
ncbi:guanyl-nucleotide exchange factor family, partial [Trichomonas vaginalis G3]|uniref:guanyl-nucleotide exchange factor family n=1 Tax=Trichomonas vaginalis (strain ATCC PRA-98 / G3) TaxID=412133 RepID=UPI0021E55D03